MKKVLFTMMAALLICGMSFAQQKGFQRPNKKVEGMETVQDAERSGWIGSTATRYVEPLSNGQFAAFVPRVVSPDMNGTITKIKIAICNWAGFAGGKMRIGLYPSVSTFTPIEGYTGLYEIPTLGTEICGQDIDITSSVPSSVGQGNIVEVTLTTPFEIPEGDFWFVVKAKENITLLYSESGGVENEWYGTIDASEIGEGFVFADNSTSTGYNSLALSLFVDDGVPYQNQSDIESAFYNSINDPTALVTSLEMGETDDLVIYPVIGNNGPDVFTTGSYLRALLTIEVNDETTTIMDDGGSIGFNLTTQNICIFGDEDDGYAVIIENSELMEIIGDATDFVVTLTAEVNDGVDPDLTNNTATILVTITHLNPVENLNANVEGANVTLTWDAPEAGGGTLQGYLIYRDGTYIGMKPTSTRTFTDSNRPDGEYEYCVVAKYKQGNAEEVCVDVTTDGINSIDAENIAVYPNPATDYVKVANAEGAAISVINNIGQVIANISNASADQEINVSAFAKGIYTIRIVNDGNVVTRQFSVNK